MMAESTESETELKKPESLPLIPVPDSQARFLSGIVTLIFTAYLTVGLMALLFQKAGFLVVRNP